MSSQPNDPKPVTGYPAPTSAGAGTAGTAYAYPAPAPGNPYFSVPSPLPPPPPSYPPHQYYPNSASSYPTPSGPDPSGPYPSVVFRRLIAVLIAFFLFFSLGTIILWLVIRPRLPEVSVASLTVSGLNVSASSQHLSGEFDLGLEFHNPNSKMVVYYDRVWAGALYVSESEPIAVALLPPFYQGKRNTTTIFAHFVASDEYVNLDVVKGIDSGRSRSSSGSVSFHFRVSAWVRFRSGIWRTRRHAMRVYCDDVRVTFKNETASTGSLADSSQKKCSLKTSLQQKFPKTDAAVASGSGMEWSVAVAAVSDASVFRFILSPSVLLLLLLSLFVIYLGYRPRKVKIVLIDASLIEFYFNSTKLDYNLQVRISIRNPNSRSCIYYDQ